MKLSDSDTDRLFAGQAPADQPELDAVAAFLTDLPGAYPAAEVGSTRAEHLYAITREARLLAAAPPPRPRRSTRRLALTAMAASLGVLTMGVGVAAAAGANPLSFLPNLLPQPAISARADTPASVPPSSVAATARPVPPTPTSRPQSDPSSSIATTTSTSPSTEKSNNGKSDEAKSEHKPTAKPSHPNNGKATAKPTPSNNARTDPPGKTKPGKSASGNSQAAQ